MHRVRCASCLGGDGEETSTKFSPALFAELPGMPTGPRIARRLMGTLQDAVS